MNKLQIVPHGLLVAFLALAAGCSYLDVENITIRAGTFAIVHVAGVDDVGATNGNPMGRLARLAEPSLRGGRDRMHGVLTTVSGGFLSRSGSDAQRTIELLNEIGAEVAAPGDRELKMTEPEFHEQVQRANFQVISNNLTSASGKAFDDMTKGIVMPVRTERGLIDVGCIGLMKASAPPAWATYVDPIEAAKKAVPETRKWSQFVVAITNLSIADEQRLIEEVPGIDLVLGSNQGETWAITRDSTMTPIAKADVNARTAVVATVTITGGNPRPEIKIRIEPLDKSPVK